MLEQTDVGDHGGSPRTLRDLQTLLMLLVLRVGLMGDTFLERMWGRIMECGPMEFKNKTCNSCYGDLVNVFKSLPSGWNLDGNMYIPAVAEEGYVAPWCLPVGHANAAYCCILHVHTPKKCQISFWRIVVALGLRADPCSATRSPSTPVFL